MQSVSNWRRQWHPTPVLLPGKSHGRRSLVGCSPWHHWESDTTEQLHFHFSLSCIGGGNGNPLQCSCLENPRDRGAWWAAVYGVAQRRTRLKRLSSSSSSPSMGKTQTLAYWAQHPRTSLKNPQDGQRLRTDTPVSTRWCSRANSVSFPQCKEQPVSHIGLSLPSF